MKLSANRFKVRGDKILWIVYIVFLLISLLEVYSTMGKMVYEKNEGDLVGMFLKHISILLSGLLITYIVHLIKYRSYSGYTKIAYVFSVGLLAMTLVMGGGNEANRWIQLPFIQFQPSEIAKYILVLYVANELAIMKESGIRDQKNFFVLLGKIAIVCGLIFFDNFSTAVLIFTGCYIMLFVAGARLKDILTPIVPLAIAIVVILLIQPDFLKRSETWNNRIEIFLNSDKEEINQPNIAKMAIATGGIMGKGIGNTTQGRFLSESHNDFIFAIILEELGIIACIVILGLYAILIHRAVIIAKKAKGLFGRYTAIGIGCMIFLQAVVNMLVATGAAPVTGQTLPFISYGGTSLWITSVALGILQNISAGSKEIEQSSEQTDLESEKIDLESEKLES
ncbi:MAG: FtsW/RodA/SpoVE family cell cycle protein [Bacteroidales bacterium]|nr:FtsW/RodA/SpoVE family cell cycle protein [Bacteroidales bacterium]